MLLPARQPHVWCKHVRMSSIHAHSCLDINAASQRKIENVRGFGVRVKEKMTSDNLQHDLELSGIPPQEFT